MANSYEMSGPHIRQLDSIEKTMWNVVLALIPATFMSVYLFGTYALYLVAGTMLACMIVEIPFNMNKEGRQIFFGDGSAAVTGIILGLSLPPTAPWWIPILGGAAAILVGKQLFGGLGNNVFNPALVGRAILSVSWTIHMTRWVTPFDGVSTSTPLATPGETASLWELFIGTVPGSIGETSALALLIGAAYLYYRGYLDLRISIPYILAAAVTAIILGINPVYTILAGSLIIGAFFIATDMVSSPATRSGRIVYGIGCGVLTVVIRVFTGFPEGVTFAILLMNGFSHLFDTLFEGYIFGQIHLKKKRIMQAGVIALSTVLFVAIAFGALQLSDRQFLEPQHRVFNQHMHDFFPHADGFNMLEELHDDRTLAEVKQGGRRVGFLAYTERIGYDGEIQNMVAINPDGEVIGSKIIDHNESATLGAQIEREDFLAQFVGLRYEDVNPTIEAGDYELDAITNATLSSIAVAQTVETSLELVNRQIHGSTYDYFDLPSGYYRGTGSGWGGEMEVEVAIEDGFLRDINVISHNDTPHKARSAFERLKTRVISAQDTDVDVISGSTMSSNGMLEAIDDALASRHVEVQDADFSHLSDGRYKGSAAGHIDDIDVEIEVQDGELVDIEILHHEETTYLAEPALETLKSRVISEQNSRVELVSGATLTSRGFLAAVADAAIEEEPFAIPQEDDTYSGTAEGYQDDIEVEVTVENGEITDIQVIDHGETEDIAEPAFEELREAVISAQSIDVDTISGATGSSRGYLSAIENALDVETAVEFDDGVYTATGDGYQGEIEIEVVIEDGEIKEITVLDHEETPDIAGPAFDDLEERVIAAQSPNVDLVTNATGTSEGYLAAVEDILQTAGLEELEPEEPEEVGLQDGTFTGVGEGYNDDIEVEITVEDEEITEIEVISHSETEDIAEPAFEDLRDEVLDAQSTDVDTISGATGSSEGFLAAVDAARNEAREEAPEEEPEVDEEVFEDGTFTGIEEGYNNDIEIEVTLEDNEIVDIQVLAHEETEDIAEPAFEDLIDDVIAAQSTDVDTVSGATGSSEGFLTAVDDALDEASRDEVPDEDEVPEIGEPEMELSDGRFTGEAVGYNDDIALEVVIENGLIVGIDVLEHDETPDIAEPAFEEMKDRVVSAQSTDVDTVTEATGSSEGFLRALNVALTESQEELEEEPEAIYEPGEYTGVGEGYNDDIEVQITVDEVEITAVEVLSHEETDDIAGPAFEDLEEAVLAEQSTDVDTVSGATGSSEGYLAAVDDALAQAELAEPEPEEEPEEPEEEIEARSAVGVGSGYNDDIEVEVTLEDNEIVDIQVLAHGETISIAEPAFEDLIDEVLATQSTDVDTASGATGSSEGFLAAIDEALAELEEDVDPEEEPEAIYEPGEYTGVGEGYNDDIEVQITVDEVEITAVEVLSHEETDDIAGPAFEDLEEAVLAEQSTDVDTVSGATGSSEGYLAAVDDALAQAELAEPEPEEEPEEPEEEIEARSAVGVGSGYNDDIEVEVTLEDNEIVDIQVLAHGETISIAEPAFEDLIDEVLATQSTDVDTASGATGSSEGFLAAVDEALAELEEDVDPEEDPEAIYEPGEYTGIGEGYNDDIEVEVTVDETEIAAIEVLSHEETEDIAEPAFADLEEAVLSAQDTDVDTISGATGSSEGYLQAVEAALDEARLDEAEPVEEPEEVEEEPEVTEESSFTGAGEGYNDEIEVEVMVEDGEIIDIQVLEHEETPDIAEPAFEDLIDDVIAAQSTDVDTVSGATGSSEGFLAAVDNALAELEEPEEPEEEEEALFEAGEYTGIGEGYNDDIEVNVTVNEVEITNIEVISHGDSEGLAELAFNELEDSVISARSTDVDTASGATGSSEGYLQAVEAALDEARLDENNTGNQGNNSSSNTNQNNNSGSNNPSSEPHFEIQDGNYTGIGEGYRDDIELKMIVEEGKIVDLEVITHDDNPDKADPAFEKLKEKVIETQDYDVSTVSGATSSSRGFIEALEEAISSAGAVKTPRVDYEDGLYTGVGQGYNDEIELEVKIEGGFISELNIIEHSDSDDLAVPAFEDLKNRVLAEQSPDIDIVSGATKSSEGFISALDEALTAAHGEVDILAKDEAEIEDISSELKDGSHRGIGEGYSDDVEIEITVEDGIMNSVRVIEHGDSPDIAEPAFTRLAEKFLEEQSPELDIVSGATGSSQGFIEAAGEAWTAARDLKTPPVDYNDGTYEGKGEGYEDIVHVEVKIEEGIIQEINVLEHSESEELGEQAFLLLKNKILGEQTADVDVVSGATQSSQGFLDAVNSALNRAE